MDGTVKLCVNGLQVRTDRKRIQNRWHCCLSPAGPNECQFLPTWEWEDLVVLTVTGDRTQTHTADRIKCVFSVASKPNLTPYYTFFGGVDTLIRFKSVTATRLSLLALLHFTLVFVCFFIGFILILLTVKKTDIVQFEITRYWKV